MAILSKASKPDKFESHNSLRLNFTNIRSLRSNFVDCESFIESRSRGIPALCGASLGGGVSFWWGDWWLGYNSMEFGQFSDFP